MIYLLSLSLHVLINKKKTLDKMTLKSCYLCSKAMVRLPRELRSWPFLHSQMGRRKLGMWILEQLGAWVTSLATFTEGVGLPSVLIRFAWKQLSR